ncbi:MAG: CdaR family protein [Fimbriimonadaceae bacterium]
MSKVVEYVWAKRENVLLFAASLLISLVLFAQLQRSFVPDKEREFEVTLTFANQHKDITVLYAPRMVRVVASGSQGILDSIDTSRVRAVVDLAGAEPGAKTYAVEVLGPWRPGLSFTPARAIVEMHIERRLRKEFDVQLFAVGTPPESYTFDGATILPEKVEVSGPESVLPKVRTVRAVLDLTRVMPNQSLEVLLEPLGDENLPVPLVTIEPSTVQIRPAVSIGPSRRELLVTPVFTGQPAFGYRVTGYSVSPNEITTSGESSDVSRMTTVDTEPISLEGLTSDRTFRVRLRLAEGLTSTVGDQVTVTVRVRRG